jgi:hypothetical protein
VNAGKAAAIARDNAAGGEQEAWQRNDGAVPGLPGIGRIAPQRVVVADAMGVVTDGVTGRLVVPRLHRVGDLDADARAQVVETLLGDLRKAAGGNGIGRHG